MNVSDEKIKLLTEFMLKPYTIPEHCPYLSEEQRELSKLTLEERSAWMADWLRQANDTEWDDEPYGLSD